jgi:hypothetical protein
MQCVFYFAIIANSFQEESFAEKNDLFLRKQLNNLFFLVNLLLLIHYSFFIWYKIESHDAFELSMIGFKKRAIGKFEKLSQSYIKDGNTMYLYSKELYYSGELALAEKNLKMTQKYFCTSELYLLLGETMDEQNKKREAEKNLIIAVNMVPNSVNSRYELLKFYEEIKDTANMTYWANSVVNMKIKVPSQTTIYLQNKAEMILKR